jgi:hypothetical protein
MKQKRFTLLIIIVSLVSVVGYYFYKNLQPKVAVNLPSKTNSPIATTPPGSATPDPTSNWKTFVSSSYGFSFKHPDTFEVKENAPGYFVITPTLENAFSGSLEQGISIDARLTGPYSNIDTARQSITEPLIISENVKIYEWEVYQGVGKDGMLKGVEFRMAITPYKTGVIKVETITNAKFLEIFDKVLSTFKFTQ